MENIDNAEVITDQEVVLKPNTNYSWELDQTLSISGTDFQTFQATVSALTSTEDFQQELKKANEVIALANLQTVIKRIFEQGVKNGLITEIAGE